MRAIDPSSANRMRAGAWWKRFVDVQWPYRRHLQNLRPGFVLDIGCGLGRNLRHCAGHGVGVDIDADVVAACRENGLVAYTPEEFAVTELASDAQFDTLLFSHVLEHMTGAEAQTLVAHYLPRLRSGGRAIFITPQEAGYRFNPTHIEFVDLAKLGHIAELAGLVQLAAYSFPFARPFGRWFRYNEFVLIARKD